MAATQKIYLGGVPVIKNYLGSDEISSFLGTFGYDIEYLVYANGGSGGNASGLNGGGGGGAGGLLSGSISVRPNEVFQVSGGSGDSYFTGSAIYEYAFTGGGGGNAVNQSGTSGGSGGGGGAPAGSGASGTAGQGFNGATSTNPDGGGGGGAAGNASGRNPGAGIFSSITGTSLEYCRGGSGASNNGIPVDRGFGGLGGTTADVSTGGAGGKGAVILRYLGPQRGTGGVVTTDGDYIIHSFASGSATYTA